MAVKSSRGGASQAGFERRGLRDGRAAQGMYIRQAARVVGVSPTVIRAWEAESLIAPQRTPAGYRLYGAADLERLRRIRDLIHRDGLNAAGVRRVLEVDGSQARPGVDHEADGLRIGERIRLLRERQGVSIRKLAALTGLSPSYVSSLERALSHPSVASLQKLAAALGTNVPTILGERPDPSANPVVKPHERRLLRMETPGVTFENLAVVETHLQPIYVTIAPGGGSVESYQHEGEEFIFMLEGRLEMTLDEVYTYGLEPGDAMTFASERPHRWWNPGDVDSVSVWLNTPQTF